MPHNHSFSGYIRQTAGTRFAAALLTTCGALLLGRVLSANLGSYVLLVAAFPAVAFSAWCCGALPSVASAAVSTLAIQRWFFGSISHPLMSVIQQVIGLALFILATATIIVLGEKRRRENEQLRQAEEQLEERVEQRTRDLDHTNEELRQLTGRLMQFQDEERRRIARELHDSVGQSLAALMMNLNTVGTDIDRLSQTAKAVSDSVALAQEMNKEVRTVSYLLHPPLLDEAGLASALRWYVEGFCQRSRIKVELDLLEDFGRLPQDWEIAVFRTVQECLTNIHRYSGSSVARIRLARSDSQICLEVQDKGIGITPERLREITEAGTPGIGIRGMRERMRQLGGRLEIHSDGHGTTVEARLPFATSSKVAA
jgi:signal transduction histidine kinase